MLRTTVTTLVLVMSASQASAIQRFNTAHASCDVIQETIAKDGEVILRFPSKRVAGLILYTRFVRSGQQCESNNARASSRVSTAGDVGCQLFTCAPRTHSRK